MIKVVKTEKKYIRCQSCYTDKKVVDISIGLQEGQTSTIRLCPECALDLYEKSLSVIDA